MGSSRKDTTAERIWNRKFVSLLIINLMVMLANYTMRPVLSNFAIELGASFAVAGAIAGLAFGVATLMRPVTGYLSDRLHKKTILVIALVAFAISSFGCAASQSMVLTGVFSSVQGVALSFQAVGVTALAALCVPRSRIGTAVGWMGIVMTASMAIGPTIASAVAAWGGYRASFALGGILCVVALVMLAFFKSPPGAQGIDPAAAGAGAAAAGIAARSKLASIVSQSFYMPAIPLALAGLFAVWAPSSLNMLMLTIEDTGYVDGAVWYFALYAVVALGSRPLAGWLSDRFRSAAVAVPLLLLGALGLAVMAFRHDFFALVLCGVLMGLGTASGSSVVQAESVRGVRNECLGRATNTYYLGVDLGCALGAWAGGLLIQVGTPVLLFVFDAFTCVAAAVIIAIVLIVRKKRNAAGE